MRRETFEGLQRLTAAVGQEYGKLVQKLLAIAWLEAGAERLIERSTQGIDLEVTIDGRRLALEVKTTQEGALRFGAKDLAGLAARREEGYEPYFAVLGSSLLDTWIFARFHEGELPSGADLSCTRLRPYRDRALADRLGDHFDRALRSHLEAAIDGGQSALSAVIEGYAAARVA
jgi:hypothetical protein